MSGRLGVEWRVLLLDAGIVLLFEELGLPEGEIDGLSCSLALLSHVARTQGVFPTNCDGRGVFKAIIKAAL